MPTSQHILYKGIGCINCYVYLWNYTRFTAKLTRTHANSQSAASNLVITKSTFAGIVDVPVMCVEMHDVLINK